MKLNKITGLLFFFLIFQINTVLAQKKNIDSNAYGKWNSIGYANISKNGKYVYYYIENEPVGGRTLVLQSTENNWKKDFKDIPAVPLISKGGEYAVFLNPNDSLMIVSMGKNLVKCIPNVASFTMCKNEESEWIAYQLKQPDRKLIVQNLNTGKKYTYTGVINKVMSDDGQTVVLQMEKEVDGKILRKLNWIDLDTGKSILISEGSKVGRIVLDTKHNQLAFTCDNGLFSFQLNTNRLDSLISTETGRLDSGLRFGGITRFSNDGNRLFIELIEEDKPKPKAGFVEVWSYLDHKLQSQQEYEIESRTFTAIVDLKEGKITRLENQFEHLRFNSFEKLSDTIGIVNYDSKRRDGFLNINDKDLCSLISLRSGKRTQLKYLPDGLSPSGRYVVYFDPEQHAYMSYNTQTRVYRIISKEEVENFKVQDQPLERSGIAGWLENDEGVLFYDNYDIWKVDLSGQTAPINLTTGYGKKHNLIFSIIYFGYGHYPLKKDQKLVLATFHVGSKKQGFYSLELGKMKEPQLLTMDDYYYLPQDGVRMEIDGTGSIIPIKAEKTEVYLVSRMSSKESLNLFSTRDFKTFKALSNVHPEQDYNWYRTELHTWKSLDGKTLHGVLYKPENFDPTKKYPVIFHYYESKSNNLNVYIKPQVLCGSCNIDIPTYISNGYLVFTPDITYKIGESLQGTYNAVVSAAKYIGILPFVDTKKIGIQGCSWGGIQTNYLVTHTNLFAAACSASGMADLVASYGRLDAASGTPGYSLFENTGQIRMGKSIWEIPDIYLKSSPILSLDKITTPFLIMHTKKDTRCLFEDAIELFTGLRRLGKKSWMLAYPEGDHGVGGDEAKDFSVRMMQFFDHYLKDKPAPIWMTRGIPALSRGLESGLAYDKEIKTPGAGLLTLEEQRTLDSLMTRKPILIELK